MQNDYKEYIETWVHEIKTPIASTMLFIENNSNTIPFHIKSEIQKIEDQMTQGIIEILERQEILNRLRNQEEALKKDRLQKIEEADNKKILHMNVN